MNLYREHVLDHYANPRHFGELANADFQHTEANPVCGDEVTIYLNIQNGVVDEFRFTGKGCAISMAAASILAERLTRRSLAEAAAFTDQQMQDELGISLSPTRLKCGLLAISALRKAVKLGKVIS
jgi:nitrogen fixation NifU-like protein